MKFEHHLHSDKELGLQKKMLLLVGDSSIRRAMQINRVNVNSHYYESLMDLIYDQPTDEYDAAVVGYRNNDTESVEAARYLTSYFRKMPIFIVSISFSHSEKILKYEKDAEFRYVPNSDVAMDIIFNRNLTTSAMIRA